MDSTSESEDSSLFETESETLEVDIAAELDAFLGKVHRRDFESAQEVFNDCLVNYLDWFPVAAEVADFLLLSGKYSDVVAFCAESLRNDNKPKETAVFILAATVAKLRLGRFSVDAIVFASIIWYHPLLVDDPHELNSVDAYLLDLLLRVAVLVFEYQDFWFNELSSFPRYLRQQDWDYFVDFFFCLIRREWWWQAQQVLRSLHVVLSVPRSRSLLQHFLEAAEGCEDKNSAVKTAISSAIQCFLQAQAGRSFSEDWTWNEVLDDVLFPLSNGPDREHMGMSQRNLVLKQLQALLGFDLPRPSDQESMRSPTDSENLGSSDTLSAISLQESNSNAVNQHRILVNEARSLESLDARTAPESDWLGRSPTHIECLNGSKASKGWLTENKVGDNKQDWFKRTPLHIAAQAGRSDILEKLLLLGGDLSARTGESGWTAVHFAALSGHVKLFYDLVEKGANVASLAQFKVTPLMLAVRQGHVDFFRKTQMGNVKIKAQSDDGRTVLLEAIRNGDSRLISEVRVRSGRNSKRLPQMPKLVEAPKALLGHRGASSKDEIWEWLLYLCAKPLADQETIRAEYPYADPNSPVEVEHDIFRNSILTLLTGGILDINHQDKNGLTALMAACKFGSIESAETLLSRPDLDVAVTDENKRSALSWALYSQRPTVAFLLLLQRPSLTTVPSYVIQPITLAVQEGYTDIVEYLMTSGNIDPRNPEFAAVKSLEKGYDSLLIVAAKDGQDLLLQTMLEKWKMDVNVVEARSGATALIRAAESNKAEAAKVLLQASSVNINHTDLWQSTALMAASAADAVAIVEMLLGRPEIDINARSRGGRTALIDAADNGNLEVVKLLLSQKTIDVGHEDITNRSASAYAEDNRKKFEFQNKNRAAKYALIHRLILEKAKQEGADES